MVLAPRCFNGAVRTLAMLVVVAAVALGAGGRAGSSTCGEFDAVPVKGGDYIYQQDQWNSALVQCASVRGTSFALTKAAFDLPTNGPPATYPSFFRGCHWGGCSNSATSGLPLRVGAVKTITSTWLTKQPASGA